MLIRLTGGLAQFLPGMHEMIEALKIVAGDSTKDLLARLTTNLKKSQSNAPANLKNAA